MIFSYHYRKRILIFKSPEIISGTTKHSWTTHINYWLKIVLMKGKSNRQYIEIVKDREAWHAAVGHDLVCEQQQLIDKIPESSFLILEVKWSPWDFVLIERSSGKSGIRQLVETTVKQNESRHGFSSWCVQLYGISYVLGPWWLTNTFTWMWRTPESY